MLHFILPGSRGQWVQSIRRIRVGLEIHFVIFDDLRTFQELPGQVHDQHNWQLDIIADESDSFKRRAEAAPTLNEHKERIEYDREPRTPGVRPVLEWEQMLFVLGSDRSTEPYGGETDGGPRKLIGNTN